MKPVGGDTAMALGAAAAAGGPESTGDLLNFIMYMKSLKTNLLQVSVIKLDPPTCFSLKF